MIRLVVAVVLLAAAVVLPAFAVFATMRRRRVGFATPVQASTFDVLHTANLAAPELRRGLHGGGLKTAMPHLRALAGTPAIAVASLDGLLAFEGPHREHEHDVAEHFGDVLASRRSRVHDVRCNEDSCPIRVAVFVPIEDGDVVGVLVGFDAVGGPGLIRALTEIAAWVSNQLSLAELDENRVRLARAELRALRAQISPHFIYNALTAIASFTRTDPERARELLLEFADFTRYALSERGQFTTVADEIRSIERYLTLEKARFGDRLAVELRVAPEVLTVVIPFLVIQPLVENAVRHGIERRASVGRVSISATEELSDCVITVEDNGVGADPKVIQRHLDGDPELRNHVGLANVDERLRTVYGDEYGLRIETAVGAGTKVIVRAPKYRPGVRAT